MKLLNHQVIKRFFLEQLNSRNVSNHISEVLINSLVNASLYGIDSHGVNLFSHYLDCIDNGRILPNQEPINNISGSRVQCDAGFGLSHYAVQPLLRELSQISDATGISMGSIVNSDHIGAVGIHSANSDLRKKIIIGFTNADALASTPDGQSSVFGTNPISLIYRHSDNEILYIDMATTIFSMNKVKNYRRNGDLLPSNVARDFEGNFTVDPSNVQRLEPIGGHKGFALAFLVEILTAGISGLDFSAEIMPMYGSPLNEHRQLSHTYIVINPAFSNNHNSDHSDHVWSLIQNVRGLLEPQQRNLSPGIKEMNEMRHRVVNGIPLLDEIVEEWLERGLQL